MVQLGAGSVQLLTHSLQYVTLGVFSCMVYDYFLTLPVEVSTTMLNVDVDDLHCFADRAHVETKVYAL